MTRTPKYAKDNRQLYSDRQAQVDTFFSTPKFKNDAIKAFQLFSTPVYFIPAYSINMSDYGAERVRRISGQKEQENALQEFSLAKPEIQKMLSALESGASVIVSGADRLRKGFLPTPWMTIHALLDNQGELDSALDQLVRKVSSLLKKHFKDGDRVLDAALTMKSARNNSINTVSDAACEIICQSIVTKAGFVFIQNESPELNALFHEITELVKPARSMMEDFMKGNIILIATDSLSLPD